MGVRLGKRTLNGIRTEVRTVARSPQARRAPEAVDRVQDAAARVSQPSRTDLTRLVELKIPALVLILILIKLHSCLTC